MAPCVLLTLLFAGLALMSNAAPPPARRSPPPAGLPMNPVCPIKCAGNVACQTACGKALVTTWNAVNVNTTASAAEGFAAISQLVMPNVTLRVLPVGTYKGLELVAEYIAIFSGSSSSAGSTNLLGSIVRPVGYSVRRLSTQGNVISATIDEYFINGFNFKQATMTIEQWFRLDPETNRVIYADMEVQRYEEFQAELQLESILTDPSNAQLVGQAILTPICQTAAAFCTTAQNRTQEYADANACLGFLTTQIDFFRPGELGSNTVVCRYLHAQLLPYAPDLHCPHVGPTGGGKCVDFTYASYYTDSPFPPAAFVP